jgi:hypothetical protein
MKTNLLAILIALGMFAASGMAFAAKDIVDGNLSIHPERDGRFAVREYKLGKSELLSYLADLQDSEKFTGLLLKRPDRASAQQKHYVVEIAQYLKIEAFSDESDGVKPLTE